MNEELKNKLEPILKDEAFLKLLQDAETEDAVKALFADKGIDLSDEEVASFLDAILLPEEGELSDEALEEVAGGLISFALLPLGVVAAGTALVKLIKKRRR